MLRDLLIGGVLGVALWGWRSYRSTLPPANQPGRDQPNPGPTDPSQAIQSLQALQKQLSQAQKELSIAVAKRAEAETQVSELNQLATDRAIELVQLQADCAELLDQVAQLSKKRPRKKHVAKTDGPITEFEVILPENSPQPASTLISSEVQPLELDLSSIQQKQVETAAAAQLLQPIFTEEAEASASKEIEESEQRDLATATVIGLDKIHSAFLQRLSQQHHWNREDLVQIAQQEGLLLDGVLEVINEAALDRCDEVLTEGDDLIVLNLDVLQELLS